MSSVNWILVFLLYSKEHFTLASEPECKGVRCYNNGTFEYHDNHCVCRCPEGFSGLLCEFQLYASDWPPGPYALPMPHSGCPESRNRGWAPGYVDVTTSSPFTTWRHASDTTHMDFNITEIVIAEEGTSLKGPFKQFFFSLNFCVKLADHTLSAGVDWPRGDFSVLGTPEGCPDGFVEETQMLNLPPIKSWSMEGYLPFIRINMLDNTLVTRYCKKSDIGPLFSDKWSSFVLMKSSGATCGGQTSNYSIIEETLIFESGSTDNNENVTMSNLSYCHYWNPVTEHLFTCKEGEFDCGRGHCIPISALCDGIATCAGGFDETDESCARRCSDIHFHCGGGQCVLKNSVCDDVSDCPDGRDELTVNCGHKCFGHRFVCDGGDCLEPLWLCDGIADCWDETDEDYANCKDALICSPDDISCIYQTCIWMTPDCNTTDRCSERLDDEGPCPAQHFHCGEGVCIWEVLLCNGEADCSNGVDELEINCNRRCYLESYYCSKDECISPEDACERMYGCGSETDGDIPDEHRNTEHPIVCIDALGMADGTIEDFQISATSWTPSHPPQMARPTLDSWCPATNDLDPFLQIDLFSPAVIGGLVLYNRVETKGTSDKHVYQEIRIPVGCRFVTISYAIFPTVYMLYKEQPFEIDLSKNFSEPQQFILIRPVLARYIRVHPKDALLSGAFCARVELIGCKNPGQLTDECEAGSEISWVPHSQLQPVTPRQSLSDILYNFNSTGDCQAACEQELGDTCAAVIYRENVSCDIYPRSDSGIQYGKISDVTPTELQLRVCWTGSGTHFMQPMGQSRLEVASVSEQGMISTNGYPFSYPADIILIWNLIIEHGRYLRLTFVDIYLNEISDLFSRVCDIVSVTQGFKTLVTLDSRYNRRVVSVPSYTLGYIMSVRFITCPRNAGNSNTGRGFRFIYRHEDTPIYMIGLMKQEGHMEQIAYPLLGIYTESYQMIDINRLSEITFHYFNVPCSEDFTFTITGVSYCNNNRPRKKIKGFELKIVFSFRGNPTLYFPEGFAASVIKETMVFPHRELVSTPQNYGVITIDGENVYNETRVCSDFLGKCYLHIETQGDRSWTLDSVTCHTLGYTLFNFHNQGEVDFVASWMTEIHYALQNKTQGVDRRLYETSPLTAYIGLLRYMGANGQGQIWEDGARVSFTNWGSGEPRDVFSNLCTELVVAKLTRETYWRTAACHEGPPTSNIGLVCEAPIDTILTTGKPIVTRSNGSRPAIPQRERSRLFPCSGGEWVHSLAVCDGIPDCFDGSDEIDCEKEKQGDCSEDEFTCADGTCIELDKVCNYVIDCSPHGNDEYCDLPRCQDGQFQCESSQCVPSFTRCDSVPDCLDESDEIGCVSCNESNSFLCGDLSCIHESRVCDRYRDCIDGRDEQGCDPPFTTCYNLWLTGTETNVTLRTVHNKTEVNIECRFYVSEDNTLTVMTHIELDNTWKIDGSQNKISSVLRQRVFTSDYKIHGDSCKQEFTYSCLDNMMEVAKYYDPHFNGSYRHCAPSTTTVYFTFADKRDVISYKIVPVDAEEPFYVFDYPHDYIVALVNRIPQNVTVGPIVCQSVYNLSDEIRCGDGRRSPPNRRCLYDIGRAGNVVGCRSYKHLEDCESFVCPQEYVKCPGSFCLATMFVCDGERQCPAGEDELNCLCVNRTSSVAIVYHGSADEQTRPYIFRFARQLYSSTHEIHTVRFYKNAESDAYYQVIRKPVHPFSESLNKEPEITVKLHGNDIVSTAVSMHVNGSMLNMIYINDDATSKRLSSAQVSNDPSIERLYRLALDPLLDTVARVTIKSARETNVFFDNWNRLSSTGNTLFPDICADGSLVHCVGQYKCSSSKICIPIHQMCNGMKNCPFGDDEEMCDFSCHDICSCHRYIADCSWSNFTIDDMATLSDTTRKLDISNNDLSAVGVFFIGKPFPRLVHLKAISCGIRSILEHSFNMTTHLLYLDLRHNKIQAIQRYTFASLTQLRILRLNGNFDIRRIDQYSFVSLVSLSELVIRNTIIEEILPNTFSGLDVNVLDISDNNIQKVHGYAVNDLSVAEFRMDGNSLNEFDSNIFSGIRNLKRLITPAFKFCCYKPTSLPEENCLPAKDEFSSCDDLMRNSALQTLLWIIGIAALIGNACVVMYRIIYDKERLKIGFGMFVTNLAVSDFLMGVYMISIAIADLSFRNRYIEMEDYWRNSGWCTFAGFLATVSSETSVLFLCLITIDRLLVIKFPFGQIRFDVKKASLFATLSWVFAVIVAIIPILYTAYFKDRFYSTTGVCIALPLTRSRPPGWLYSFLIFICLNFLAFILIAAGQLMIYQEIKLNTRRMKKVSSKRRNDLKIARNLFLVLLTDFLCWFPIGVMGILALRGHEIPGDVYAWTAVLILPINSALNPFLYTLAAILGKKSFSPRVDEQIQQTKEGISGKFVKFYNSKAIVPMETTVYDILADLLPGNTIMTTEEILAVSLSVVRTFCHLHDMGLVHGDLDVCSVLIDRRMIGQVSLKIQPKKMRAKGSTEKDIHDLGQVIGHMLRLTKTA